MAGLPLAQRLRDKTHKWGDLAKLIPDLMSQSVMGYTYTCPDMIGGGEYQSFLNGASIDEELVVRSAQVHALMPMMQFSVAPWRVLDNTHYAAVDKIVKLRQQYVPYIMSVMRNAAKTGQPALKSLEYEYPNQGYMNVNDQFLLGDKLMIAPVVTTDDTRKVVIPKGKWRLNNKIITGPAVNTYTVALDELLIFEKVIR